MNELLWILKKLHLSYENLASERRSVDYTERKWVIMWFFRLQGKSYPAIGKIIGKDQSSCRYGCVNSSANVKNLAEKLLFEYITEVLHQTPPEKRYIPEEKTTIRVPDYKNNYTYLKEVPVSSIKKFKKIRKCDL